MSKRLQVLMPDDEMKALRTLAAMEGLTVGEYVRRALREVQSQRPSKTASSKLAVIRDAVRYSFPTADVGEMNREIERGYAD